jgi:hypothetical protein
MDISYPGYSLENRDEITSLDWYETGLELSEYGVILECSQTHISQPVPCRSNDVITSDCIEMLALFRVLNVGDGHSLHLRL